MSYQQITPGDTYNEPEVVSDNPVECFGCHQEFDADDDEMFKFYSHTVCADCIEDYPEEDDED